ncbi:hypothetical protein EFA69_13530 [Rufibacter immobilis]|uniref:Lipocalin-like domain-containing protein n=1 Tax=Rufibacter immobilis TaxID=1348778 RepID=A0A3M9MQM8_9BACT|nr:hypothetical protein [Rufibacter immobilis]RNI27183.1 hypothetical protein EFA69_13530 [Rufibacter immobilis]
MNKINILLLITFLFCSCETKHPETNNESDTYKEFNNGLVGVWQLAKEEISKIDSAYLTDEGQQYINSIKDERPLFLGCLKSDGNLQIKFSDNRLSAFCAGDTLADNYSVTHKEITIVKSDTEETFDYKLVNENQLEITTHNQDFSRKLYFNKVKESH